MARGKKPAVKAAVAAAAPAARGPLHHRPRQNALVQPIAQVDAAPWSKEDPDIYLKDLVDIPAALTFVNWQLLQALQPPSGSGTFASGSNVKIEDDDDEIEFVSMRNLKRKPSVEIVENLPKRSKQEQTFATTVGLFETSCLFRLERMEDGAGVREVLSDAELGDAELHVVTKDLPQSDETTDALLKTVAIEVCLLQPEHPAGRTLAILPIVDTYAESFATSTSIWRSPNGQWIPSAVRLADRSILRLETRAMLVSGGTVLKLSFVGSLAGELIWAGEDQSRMALAANQILDVLEVARFAGIYSDVVREEQRRRGIDASAIYANLAPARTQDSSGLQPIELEATLLPFQRRSTGFLLGREGKQMRSGQMHDCSGEVMTNRGFSKIGIWWEQITDSLFFNVVSGVFASSADLTRTPHELGSALLAEEMGLGKTVEILALILLNPASTERRNVSPYYDEHAEIHVQPVKTTLIVCPEVLRQQWIEEIERHAPSLEVYSFEGHQKAAKHVPKDSTWQEFAKQFDVMVVSFSALSKELFVAMKEKPRSRRAPRQYERPRSPLIQLDFHRVICDEVQMVGNATQAAEVASLLPRSKSVAVSGTPIKVLDDLGPLFRFLRLDFPPSVLKKSNLHVLAPCVFQALNVIATRHLKAGVQAEMTLPKQHRYVVPIDFTAVEAAYYETTWNKALDELGLDARGAPRRNDWQLDIQLMRAHLLLLRQACTHPQVAGRALGTGQMAQGNLRSMGEVLIFMKEQSASEVNRWSHAAASKIIDRITIQLQDVSAKKRHSLAQAALEGLIEQLEARRQAIKEDVREAHKYGPGYRFATAEIGEDDGGSDLGDDDEETERRSPRDLARRAHRQVLRMRHRGYTELLARATHWSGNVAFQRGELADDDAVKMSFKDAEDKAYASAEKLRGELLREARLAVDRTALSTKRYEVTFAQAEMTQEADEIFELGGIRTKAIFEEVLRRIKMLDENAALLYEWRKQIKEVLYTAVNRDVSEENPEDDQYAEALDAQGKAEVFLEMYRPLLARRLAILTHQTAIGSTALPAAMKDLETVIKIARQQKRRADLLGQGQDVFPTSSTDEGGLEALTETDRTKLKHFRELAEEINKVSLPALKTTEEPNPISLTELLMQLRGIADGDISRREEEIVRLGSTALRRLIKHQTTFVEPLRRELDAFAKLFNGRAEYFKQLQALSDALTDISVPSSRLQSRIAELQNEVDSATVSCKKHEGRLRYLQHLGKMEEEGLDDEAKKCIICTDEIKIGILLSHCGHVVCNKCYTAWTNSHSTCPICRAPTGGASQTHRIIYSKKDAGQREQLKTSDNTRNMDPRAGDESSGTAQSIVPAKSATREFNFIDTVLQARIEDKISLGRYGSKLDMLVKHLIYISDEGSQEKTIVFSAFARGLELVADALRQNGLRYETVAAANKSAVASIRRFTHEDINILLLHSEATSAGLNLMATKNIILLEPLVNSGTERQALGRVHRIGQTKETKVFVYYLRDSVEERILHLAAARGQSLYLKPEPSKSGSTTKGEDEEQDSGQVIADTMVEKREKGDYVHSVDDLLSCFFSDHSRSNVEAGSLQSSPTRRPADPSPLSVAVAGPSTPTTPTTSSSSTTTNRSRPLTDAERARQARIEAIDRRRLAETAATTATTTTTTNGAV